MDVVMSERRPFRLSITAFALFLGGLAWIAAFWFPAFLTSTGTAVAGYWVFATGWMGFSVFQFAWYANLLILLAVILMYTSPLWATVLAGAAVLVATQSFWFEAIPGGEVDMPIAQLGLGFWCWYSSMILMAVGVFFGSEETESEQNQTVVERAPAIQPVAPVPAEPAAAPAAVAPFGMPERTPAPVIPVMAAMAASKPESPALLTEDWPQKISLVVTGLPLTTEASPQAVQTAPEPVNATQPASGWDDDDEIQFFTGRNKAGIAVALNPVLEPTEDDEILFFTGQKKAGNIPASSDSWED